MLCLHQHFWPLTLGCHVTMNLVSYFASHSL